MDFCEHTILAPEARVSLRTHQRHTIVIYIARDVEFTYVNHSINTKTSPSLQSHKTPHARHSDAWCADLCRSGALPNPLRNRSEKWMPDWSMCLHSGTKKTCSGQQLDRVGIAVRAVLADIADTTL